MAFIFNVLTIIVLLVGVYAFFYTFRLHKKGLDFASPYVGFILCWNLLILERFVFGYFEIGAFDMSRVDTWSTVLFVCDSILRVLAAFGSVYFFVRVLSYFSGKDMSRKLIISFSVAFISLSFFLGAGTGLAILDSNYEWLTRIQYYSINASLLLLLIFAVVYNQKNKTLSDNAERNRAVAFGKFYSTCFFVLSAIFILSIWNLFSSFLIVFLYLLMNIFPPAWHRISIFDAELERKNALYRQAIERIKEEYQLTPREEEVCLLLLEGLSDREIQKTFSVTAGTVKKHISNINKKLGIRSREELDRFFSDKAGIPPENDSDNLLEEKED